MKKTAKELVYDALNYMRKPTADIALSPIKDSDDLKDTYGFTEKDVCKFIDAMSVDCEKDLAHNPIHEVNTVGEIIEVVDSMLKGEDPLSKLRDSLYMLKISKEIDNDNSTVNKMLNVAVYKRIIVTKLGLDLSLINDLEKAIVSYTKASNQIMKVLIEGDNTERFMSLSKDEFEKLGEEIKNDYIKMMEVCKQ